MKRINNKLLLLLAAAALLTATAVSCTKTEVVETMTNIEALEEDYATLIKHFPELDRTFVEAQYELNGILSQAPAESLHPDRVDYVCYYKPEGDKTGYVAYMHREFCDCQAPTIVYTDSESDWSEDIYITNFKGFITLAQAIAIVKSKGKHVPDTRYVTLRHPAGEDSPRYIFGGTPDRESEIHVDARTGEIFEK